MSDWITTLTLVFGGCCSNALTLEQITSRYPDSGTLITFFQFLLISLHGLPKHVTFSGNGRIPYPRLKPRRIPLTPYLVQVVLFYVVSLLNNAAFGFQIPMPVHIIFRSGGLIVSMILGWLIVGKRYNFTQVTSVSIVTLGVVLTTLSASRPKTERPIVTDVPSTSTAPIHFSASYAMGIIILSVALIFAGLLGLVQDWTFSQYGRSWKPADKNPSNGGHSSDNLRNGSSKSNSHHQKKAIKEVPPWQESLFYLHFLAMPMFVSVRKDLIAQFRAVHSGPKLLIPLSLVANQQSMPWLSYPLVYHPTAADASMLSAIQIPTAYFPLLLNTFTQLLCASGVHRLTGKVSSLTVTLTLVVRKAVSLLISVLLYGDDVARGNMRMWCGAALVLVGTVGYSIGGSKKVESKNKKE